MNPVSLDPGRGRRTEPRGLPPRWRPARQKINKQKLPSLGQRVCADGLLCRQATWRASDAFCTEPQLPDSRGTRVFEEVFDLVAVSKLPDPTEPLARGYCKGDLAVWKNRSNSPPPQPCVS